MLFLLKLQKYHCGDTKNKSSFQIIKNESVIIFSLWQKKKHIHQ